MANIWGTYARASFPGNWTPVCFFTSKAMATHSSTLAWKSPWTEEPGGLQSMGSWRVWTRLSDFSFTLTFHFSLSCIGEGNGNPLQCSYLENPRDGGAWWAAVYGVAQSRTRLKQLSSSIGTPGVEHSTNHRVTIFTRWTLTHLHFHELIEGAGILSHLSQGKGSKWLCLHTHTSLALSPATYW